MAVSVEEILSDTVQVCQFFCVLVFTHMHVHLYKCLTFFTKMALYDPVTKKSYFPADAVIDSNTRNHSYSDGACQR